MEPSIVQQLSSYWAKSPSASDDPAGIHRWWLADTQNVTLDEVIEALAWMVQQGLIEERRMSDGRVRYRRKPTTRTSDLEQIAAHGPNGRRS